MDTIKVNKGATRMVAHRGLSGIERENTAAAFVAAGNRSHFGIETDVHLTLDEKFIIIHDHDTLRVSGTELHVEESNLEELRALCLMDREGRRRADLCLPTLDEYLRIMHTYDKIAVLEIKGSMQRHNIAEILDTVRAEHSIEKTVFISFDFDNLVFVRELCADARIQYLCGGEVNEELIERLCRYGVGLDHYFGDLTESTVKELHERGIEVNCWTVDDPADAERLISWGVDYITSNILE